MKRIIFWFVLILLAFTIQANATNAGYIFVIKNPVDSEKAQYVYNHDFKYKVESSKHTNNNEWTAILTLEAVSNTSAIRAQLESAVGNTNSAVYDCGLNTNCSYYLKALGVE